MYPVLYDARGNPSESNQLWWTTSGGSTFIPSYTTSAGAASSSGSADGSTSTGLNTSPSLAGASSGQIMTTTFTSSFPFTTITQSSSTFTSFSETVVTSTFTSASSDSMSSSSSSSSSPTSSYDAVPTAFSQSNENAAPVCIGNGLDASADGIIATIVVPSVVGLLIWITFAIVRPRFREVYGLREWFVQQDLRPRPLSSSFGAFLFPPVPLIPKMPKDVSDAGSSPTEDAELFPSDEQLSQRGLYIALLIVLVWSFLAIAGVLPLYLVSTPCLADTPASGTFSGAYSTLQDLSLLRLLQFIDVNRNATNVNVGASQRRNVLSIRAVSDGQGSGSNAHIRVIILTVLTILLGVLPVLWKLMKEFDRLLAYRQRWIEFRCEGQEMGWLSASKAPGFKGWGEMRLKTFISQTGLSSSLEGGGNAGGRRNGSTMRRGNHGGRSYEREGNISPGEEAKLEVDIKSLFTIGDTSRLALLIDERDEILENLEIAETRYISSFRITTPDPSLADMDMLSERGGSGDTTGPRGLNISRPLPLSKSSSRRRKRTVNPAFATSSLTPTSFVAPSQYYRLRAPRGVSGGRFATDSSLRVNDSSPSSNPPISRPRVREEPTFSSSIHSRVVGSRFQEINRNSSAFGKMPLGSHVQVDESGELGPMDPEEGDFDMGSIPDPRHYGPNYDERSPGEHEDGLGEEGEEWVDITRGIDSDGQGDTPTTTGQLESDYNGGPPSALSRLRQHRKQVTSSSKGSKRETFPKRKGKPGTGASGGTEAEEELLPPHMRLQSSQPFVRPMTGINFTVLGEVYSDIRQWRTRLKKINVDIAEAQRESYAELADGQNIKGWILVGKGLSFVQGIEMIEGRAKEDVRWDVLQSEGEKTGVRWYDGAVVWSLVAIVLVLLAAGLTATIGLALADAPDVTSGYLPFLRKVSVHDNLWSGIATTLVPAVATIVFIIIALGIIHRAATIRGTVSISAGQLLVFKLTFFVLCGIATVVVVVIGALLFSVPAFNNTGNINQSSTESLANGSIYMSVLAFSIVITMALVVPGLLLLQPQRLWHVVKAEKRAVTPRQRFRAVYPRPYDPSFATGACILAIIFASTFAVIFPLMGPAVCLLLLLTLIAHRFLIGYVYARTHSQTGGIIQIWLLKRFGTLVALQPLLLGLVLLSRTFWIEGGVLIGTAVGVVLFVEIYTSWTGRRMMTRRALSNITLDSLGRFEDVMTYRRVEKDGEGGDEMSEMAASNTALGGARGATGGGGSMARLGHTVRGRSRGSMASVLEMMSLTLAVMPSPSRTRGPVPLQTETLDDLTATERAARTHPDAPPHLPPLPFADHAEEMAGILYAPELIAPPPIIWLPNDNAGVARSEAVDLQKYHDLQVTLDVRSNDDVMRGRSSK